MMLHLCHTFLKLALEAHDLSRGAQFLGASAPSTEQCAVETM